MILGDRLRKLRERKGLNQKELAARLKIPNQNVSNYERGFRQPDYETLQKLADYFEVSIDYLLGRTDDSAITKNKTTNDKNNDINKSDLTEQQQAVLEWALGHKELSFSNKKEDIIEMLDRFVAFYEFEQAQKRKSKDKDK